jgi:hypothetical protein
MATMACILARCATIAFAFLAALLVPTFILLLPLVEVALFLVVGHADYSLCCRTNGWAAKGFSRAGDQLP